MECPKCKGSGELTVTCRTCKGTGWVRGEYGKEICCGGGDSISCPLCEGSGEVEEEE